MLTPLTRVHELLTFDPCPTTYSNKGYRNRNPK